MHKAWFLFAVGSVLTGCSPSISKTVAPLSSGDRPAAPVEACLDVTNTECAAGNVAFDAAWQKAWTGDYQAQKTIAAMQSTRTPGATYDPVNGCAWRIMMKASHHAQYSGTDEYDYRMACSELPPLQIAEAKRDAKAYYKAMTGLDIGYTPAPQD